MDVSMTQSYVDAVTSRDLRICAQLITRVEAADPEVRPVLHALYALGGHSRVIGITGPPGAGKSTLVNQLITHYRQQNLRVAILAVDPSSPYSGGAVLGDRLRMGVHDVDPGVFIRSMATRGVLGGLSRAVGDALTILDAMRWDVVIVETVGVGQNETDIVRHTGCIVLLQTALGGDAVQSSKAGILEIGDIFVVNKSDVSGSDRMVGALNEMIARRAGHGDPQCWQPVVLKTEAISGQGVSELCTEIERRFSFLSQHPEVAMARRLDQLRRRALEIAKERISVALEEHSQELLKSGQLTADVRERRTDPYELSETMIRMLGAGRSH
jgi:LAO/AO transport system kinase